MCPRDAAGRTTDRIRTMPFAPAAGFRFGNVNHSLGCLQVGGLFLFIGLDGESVFVGSEVTKGHALGIVVFSGELHSQLSHETVEVPFSIRKGLCLKVAEGGVAMAAGVFLGACAGLLHKGGAVCVNVGGDHRGKDDGGVVKGTSV